MPTSQSYGPHHRSPLPARICAQVTILIAACALLAPVPVAAHTAGSLDPHGCHSDTRKHRDYHCHRGRYNGIRFSSKADMLRKKKLGLTAEDLRGVPPASTPGATDTSADSNSDSDSGWSLFGLGNDKAKAPPADGATRASSSTKPRRSIEDRLRTLKDLHSEGLITNEEYEAKKAEILADL